MESFNAFNLSSLAMSSVAVFMATLALFPALKTGLAMVRDAVLWLAVFVILGGGGFAAFMQWQQLRASASTSFAHPAEPLTPGFRLVNDTATR